MTEAHPLKVIGKCVASDEELIANMEATITRRLPEVEIQQPRAGTLAVVASGPSVSGELETIRRMQMEGTPIVAIKDSHDWLIERGVIPDYAFAVDPQEHRWDCFKLKHPDVHYIIASQCNRTMFDHLHGHKVTVWHTYMQHGQKRPLNKMLIGGATTSGLRALSVFWVMGWRNFALFGYDSCLQGDMLRVNGTGVKESDPVLEIKLDPASDKVYRCNPSMALQAQHFEEHYGTLSGSSFTAYGEGLIPAIIARHEENARALAAASEAPQPDNGRVSFIHCWGMDSASFRYRSWIPSLEIGADINDFTASTLIFSKIEPHELMQMALAKARGQWVVVDFCDDHFDWMHYKEALRLADAVTCSTEVLRDKIRAMGRDAAVIPDPWEYSLEPPHCQGNHILWFGHHVNRSGLQRILPDVQDYPLHVVGNFGGAIPWSKDTMLREFAGADIVILPATEEYKSCNRAVESIRQGCFVVAEPHPSLMEIPGIWIGNIKEGIEWAKQHTSEARQRTSLAQTYVTEKFSPRTVTAMWRNAIQRPTTSEAGVLVGAAGST